MRDAESIRLLHGPYSAWPCRVGDKVVCEFWGHEVVVGGLSDGLNWWPTVKMKGWRSLIVCGDPARAVRSESGVAVTHHRCVSCVTVTESRRALGVEPMNEDLLRLIRHYVELAWDSARTPEVLPGQEPAVGGEAGAPEFRRDVLSPGPGGEHEPDHPEDDSVTDPGPSALGADWLLRRQVVG